MEYLKGVSEIKFGMCLKGLPSSTVSVVFK